MNKKNREVYYTARSMGNYKFRMWPAMLLNPKHWGWAMNNNVLEPITAFLSPAPDELVNMIFCNRKKGCGTNWNCKKIGM